MAFAKASGLLGIHVNMPATVPPNIARALKAGDPAPDGLSDAEKRAYASLNAFYTKGSGYYSIMGTRPQTLGYGLADSPVALAAWFYDKFAAWTYSGGQPERALTKDEMLDDITLYWLTNTGTSSSQSYWEVYGGSPFNAIEISIPVGVTVFPGEIYQAPPRRWAEQNHHKLMLFQRSRQRRPLCGLGAARTLRFRGTGRVRIPALRRPPSEACRRPAPKKRAGLSLSRRRAKYCTNVSSDTIAQ